MERALTAAERKEYDQMVAGAEQLSFFSISGKMYGYCRISRPQQSIERQIRNIKNEYPEATIIKEAPAKEQILRLSRSFNGSLSDLECMKLIGISRNTFYKYKGELKSDL